MSRHGHPAALPGCPSPMARGMLWFTPPDPQHALQGAGPGRVQAPGACGGRSHGRGPRRLPLRVPLGPAAPTCWSHISTRGAAGRPRLLLRLPREADTVLSRKCRSLRCGSAGPAGHLPLSRLAVSLQPSAGHSAEVKPPAGEGAPHHRTVSSSLRGWGRCSGASFHSVPSGADLPLPAYEGLPVPKAGSPELLYCFVREPQRLFVCPFPAGFSRGESEAWLCQY